MVRLDKLDGTTVDIDTGDGTLQGLVDAVNNAGEGVRASTIKLDDGSYRLRLESVATGAASDFDLTNVDGTALLGGQHRRRRRSGRARSPSAPTRSARRPTPSPTCCPA